MTESEARRLKIWERALLFQYIIEKGLPPWADNDSVQAFARLMNITNVQALAAFERARHAGYLDKV